MAAGGFMPGDLAAAGTPSNLGRIGETGMSIRHRLLADAHSIPIQHLQILIRWA